MKKNNSIFIIFTIVALFYAGSANAETTGSVEKALEGVKQTVDDLVSAKDDKTPQELPLRIQTFRKVLELSIAEAKDLKLRLLSEEPEEKELISFHEDLVKKISEALKFYEEKNKKFSLLERDLNLEDIRLMAEDFQNTRTANFSTPTQTAHDYLASRQPSKALEIAENRFNKIENDLKKMGRNRTTENLKLLLKKASKNLEEAKKNKTLAEEKFKKDYLLPKEEVSINVSISSSFLQNKEELEIETSAATSTPTSTIVEVPVLPPPPSIRDLVQESLTHVKEAYQVFIEMSAVVRKANIR
jgi:hypothetical protein